MDHVAGFQAAVLIGERSETLIDKPIVQRTHPAGTLGAVLFRQRLPIFMDGSNIGSLVGIGRQVVFGFVLIPRITADFQCLEDHGHHAVICAKLVFAGDDGAGERSGAVRRVLHADSHGADGCAGVILGFACLNGLSSFRDGLDFCNSLITGGLDLRFRSCSVDRALAGLQRSFQLGNASFIILALVAGIERGFDDRDGRIFQLGDRLIVERFKHPLVIRLGNHFRAERDGAAIFGVLRNLVGDQIVAGIHKFVIFQVSQRLLLCRIPRCAAVNRPYRPVLCVRGCQIITDKHILSSICACGHRSGFFCPRRIGNTSIRTRRDNPFDLRPSIVRISLICLMRERSALGEPQVDRRNGRKLIRIDLGQRFQRRSFVCGQERFLIGVQRGVCRLKLHNEVFIAGRQRCQIIREIGEVFPKRCENCRMVKRVCTCHLQCCIVCIERIHQIFERCRGVLVGFQRAICGCECPIVRRCEIVVVEALIIRFCRRKVFTAVLGNQRVHICRFGDMDDSIITGIERIVFANGNFPINRLERQIIRRHIEHGNGVIAGFSENVFQIAAGIRCRRCLVRRLRQRFRLRRVADKERDVLCALTAGCTCVCAGHSSRERSLIAHGRAGRSRCVDHGIAVFVVTETGECREDRDFGRIVAGRILTVEHLKRDTHQTNNVAGMELDVVPLCFCRPTVISVMAAVDIECEHRVFIAVIARPQAGERRVIVRINSDPSKVKRRAERGVSTCQAKTGVGIQISPFPPEPLVLCGEVVDIGKGNGNVLGAGKLLAGILQRVNMCRIMRPLTAFIVGIIAVERFQHGVIFRRTANDPVRHIVLEHIVGADIRRPRLRAVIAFVQLGRVILLDQCFGFCLAAQIVLVSSVVKLRVDQLVRISRRHRSIKSWLTINSWSRTIHIERIQQRLCRYPCRFIGIPCNSGTVICADRCSGRIAQFSLSPAPCGIDSLIERR